METIEKIVIVGAGGFGREVAAVIRKFLHREFELLGYVDDGLQAGKQVNGLPVLGGLQWLNEQSGNLNVALAIGSPELRKKLRNKIRDTHKFPNIIHPAVSIHDPEYVSYGHGNIICEGVIMTTNIQLGNYNIINLSCTIGHDVILGDYCSVMPGVNISGGASLGNGVYIGTGVKLIKATELGDSSVVGAGAVVVTDIPAGKTYAGVPAKELYNG